MLSRVFEFLVLFLISSNQVKIVFFHYIEMDESMKKVASMDVELTVEERNQLNVA